MKSDFEKNYIRCFIAVTLPDPVIRAISDYLIQLKNIAPEIRWVRATGIHITLKFLGELPPDFVDRIAGKLEAIKSVCPPFTLSVSGEGCFPNRHKPRVFWLGLEHDAANSLFTLQEWIDTKLHSLDIEKEKRRFSPHLTLGRVKTNGDFSHVFRFFAGNPFPAQKFAVDKVTFIRSKLLPQGAEYTTIRQYELLK